MLVLRAVAEGLSYAQIVERHPSLTYLSIFAAAQEALTADEAPGYQERMDAIKRLRPRAYERWTKADEERLLAEHLAGSSLKKMAAILGRQPSAISSRLVRLALEGRVTPEPRPRG